jgi:catechol 2,3-dioxygenase
MEFARLDIYLDLLKITSRCWLMSLSPLQSHQAPIFIDRVELIVRDLEGMTQFYRDVIGLSVISATTDIAHLGCDDKVILQLRKDPHARLRSPDMPGLFHTAFLMPARSDLGNWLKHAITIQVPMEGLSDHRVSEAAYLSDPEGNGIEIYIDRPSQNWFQPNTPITMGTARMDVEGVIASAIETGTGTYKMPSATRIGHVHLSVADLAQAGDILTNVIGLRKTTSYPQADFYASGNYHHHVAVNTWHSGGVKSFQNGVTGLENVILNVPGAEDHKALSHRLLKAGGKQIKDKIQLAGPSGILISLAL